MSEFVTHRQIKECFELTKSCLRSVKDLVMKQEKSKKRIYAILNFIAKGSVSKGLLSNEMDINLGVKSPNKRTEIIKELVNKKYIDVFKEGKSDMLYITEAGRNYLDFEE